MKERKHMFDIQKSYIRNTFRGMDHSTDVTSDCVQRLHPHLSKYLKHLEIGCYGQEHKRTYRLHSTTSRWSAQGSPSPNSPRLKHKLHITGLSHINHIWVTSSANYETIIRDHYALIFPTRRMKVHREEGPTVPSILTERYRQATDNSFCSRQGMLCYNNTYKQNKMYTSISNKRLTGHTVSIHRLMWLATASTMPIETLQPWILKLGHHPRRRRCEPAPRACANHITQPVPSLQILTMQWTRR